MKRTTTVKAYARALKELTVLALEDLIRYADELVCMVNVIPITDIFRYVCLFLRITTLNSSLLASWF